MGFDSDVGWTSVSRGCWYHSPPVQLDHMSVSMNPRGARDQQQQAQLFTAILKRGRLMSGGTNIRASLVQRAATDGSMQSFDEAPVRATSTIMSSWEVRDASDSEDDDDEADDSDAEKYQSVEV